MFIAIACGFFNFLLFNEQYNLTQVIGILVITVGAQIYNLHWSYDVYLYSIPGGIITLVLFSIRGIMNKWASALEFDAYTGGLLGCYTDSVIGLLAWVILYVCGQC